MEMFFARKAWDHGLAHPFFVPRDLLQIQVLLSDGQMQAAIEDLWARARLGSESAAATLAYICLRDPTIMSIDSEAVRLRCREAANRRCGFAQYVVAWQEYQQDNFKEYARWLHQSAKNSFQPALGDIGRALLVHSRKSRRSQYIARIYFQRAISKGHLLSILYMLRACKEGAFGRAYRVPGSLVLPLATLVILPIVRLFPFSISVFSYPVGTKKPLFTRNVIGRRP